VKEIARLLNEMRSAGVILNYALFGATAQMRYTDGQGSANRSARSVPKLLASKKLDEPLVRTQGDVRMTVEIDEGLIRQAMKSNPSPTKRSVIEAGLVS
jgi:hypothetical protein